MPPVALVTGPRAGFLQVLTRRALPIAIGLLGGITVEPGCGHRRQAVDVAPTESPGRSPASSVDAPDPRFTEISSLPRIEGRLAAVPEDVPTILVTRRSIAVDGRDVILLNEGRVVEAHEGAVLEPLYSSLIASLEPTEARDPWLPGHRGWVLLAIDHHVPYQTVLDVSTTAGAAGFGPLGWVIQTDWGLGVIEVRRPMMLNWWDPVTGALVVQLDSTGFEVHDERDPEASSGRISWARDDPDTARIQAHLERARRDHTTEAKDTVLAVSPAADVPFELVARAHVAMQRGWCAEGCEGPHSYALMPGRTRALSRFHDRGWTILLPYVRYSRPEIDGAYARDDVVREVRRHFDTLRACYTQALKRDDDTQGHFDVEYEIDAHGRIVRVGLLATTMEDPSVARCVTPWMRRLWKFPPPPSGKAVTIRQRFIMKPPLP